jgi:hypothetical protein
VIKWLIRNERWLGVALAAVVAICFSAYVGFFTAVPSYDAKHHRLSALSKILELGAVNILVLAGVVCLVGQSLLTVGAGRQEVRDARFEAERLCAALLEATVRMLTARRRQICRALVTVADKKLNVRKVVCGANIRVDPETGVSVPIDFGVAGDAFMRRSMQAGNITDAIRGKAADGSIVPGIWNEIRCVLAFPMLSANGEAFGTVNFDSDKPLEVSGLGDRSIQEALARVAQLITYLMRSYEPDRSARFPD